MATVKQAKESALKKYEERQAEIRKLLKQIDANLMNHDRNASSQGGHNWTHVGDLNHILDELQNINNFIRPRKT